MRIIDCKIDVISDDVVYLTVVRKYVCCNGDLANYSKFTLRFKHLSRAMHYVGQMVRLLSDKDYHVSVNIVRAS
mgnify:FL=1